MLADVRMGLNEDNSSDGGFGLEIALATAIHNLLLTIFIMRKYIILPTLTSPESGRMDCPFGIIIFEWKDKEGFCP